MSEAQFITQHVAKTPENWRVRTVRAGEHELRVAFPPGPRRTGSGELVEILHPKGENPCRLNVTRVSASARESMGFKLRRAGANPVTRDHRLAFEYQGVVYDPEELADKLGIERQLAANPLEELVIFGNPAEEDQSLRLYEQFHGRDPREILRVQRSAAMQKTYVGCGPLLGIGIFTPGIEMPGPKHWDDYPSIDLTDDEVMLAANSEGTQLYAIGGNQDLDDEILDQWDGVDPTKDLIALCEAAFVVYADEKPHSGYRTIDYMHKFDPPRPVVGYDKLKREIFFAGGRYKLEGNWIEH